MSEPLSSTEIEDVLSSIRRLVSDDTRSAPKPVAMAGDKLILTPALRVVQAVPAGAPPEADAPPMFVAVPRSTLMDAPRSGLGDVVASVGAAVDESPDDWEAETGDSAPHPDLAAGNPWAMPVDAAFAEDMPEDLPEDLAEDHPGITDHFEYHAEPVPTPAWAQVAEAGHEDDDIAPATALHGTVEPDPVWADAAEASVIAELAEPEVDEEDAFDQGMRFDEDVLRELVRDMLREELAGKMGERITRNIRKLVRAEIARALAAQEFE
ncbi:MAG: hypothetical protein CFE33_06820 [Pseudorhodobacter sp. PARRP1]|nr:MAG: hypothetical protein CFE33_06820 [Pseudorhodobacter sp. PARRP1]